MWQTRADRIEPGRKGVAETNARDYVLPETSLVPTALQEPHDAQDRLLQRRPVALQAAQDAHRIAQTEEQKK